MKLRYLKARDCLSFGDDQVHLPLDDFNTIVGPNNSGKTNVLRILTFAGELLRNSSIDTSPYYHRGDFGKGFEIEIGIQLSEDERDALSHFAICSTLSQSFMHLPEATNQSTAMELRNRFARQSKPLFDRVFNEEAALSVTARGSHTYPPDVRLTLHCHSPPLVVWSYGRLTLDRPPGNQYVPTNIATMFTDEAEARRPGILKTASIPPDADSLVREITAAATPDWLAGYLASHQPGIPVVADLSGFRFSNLEGQGQQSEPALLSLRAFLRSREAEADELSIMQLFGIVYNTAIIRTFGIPPLSAGTPGDALAPNVPQPTLVTSSSLAESLFGLKNSPADEKRVRFEEIRKVFREISGSSFDVVLRARTTQATIRELSSLPAETGPAMGWVGQGYRPSFLAVIEKTENQLVNEAAILVTSDSHSVPIEFGAAGLLDLLVALFAIISSRNQVILLDEPAMNLHPTKQKRLLQEILKAVSRGNQAVIVTHSPYFVSTRHLRSVTRVQVRDSSTVIHRFELKAMESRAEKWMERDPKIVAALFADKTVLVEGADEEAALPEWLRKCAQADVLEEKNALLFSVGGQESFRSYASILSSWNIPFRIVCDRKAKQSLGELSQLAFVLDAEDFTEILKECQPSFDEAIKSSAGRQGNKDPSVARIVARESDPPPRARIICEGLVGFLESQL